MWWLQPIAWFRWSIAGLVVVAVIVVELGEPPTIAYPFAADAIEAGVAADEASIEWREVPEGLLPHAQLAGSVRTDIDAGSPITPDRLTATSTVPADWWVIELPVGRTATVGAEIRIVVLDPRTTVTGVLTGLPEPDPFGGDLLGAVAIPPDSADLVARAAANDAVVTMARHD